MTWFGGFEIFMLMFVGQGIMILQKLNEANKKFGVDFSPKKYFSQNKYILAINVVLILLFGYIYLRGGVDDTVRGLSLSAEWWFSIAKYILIVFSGYCVQGVFNYFLKNFLRKTGIELSSNEKPSE